MLIAVETELIKLDVVFLQKKEENKPLLPSYVASLPLSDEMRVCSVWFQVQIVL